MTVYAMRHGECELNHIKVLNGRSNSSLTEQGKLQPYVVVKKLKEKKIKAIYTSPLKRAKQTAVIMWKLMLAENKEVDIEVLQELVEREFGVLTGKPEEEIPKYSRVILNGDQVKYFLDTPGAEPYEAVCERAKKILALMQQKHPNEDVLLVTHGALIQCLRAIHYDIPWQKALVEMPYIDNADVVELNGAKPQ